MIEYTEVDVGVGDSMAESISSKDIESLSDDFNNPLSKRNMKKSRVLIRRKK